MAWNHYPSILIRKPINMLISPGCFLQETTLRISQYSELKRDSSLFLILGIAKFLRAIILKNICEQLLVKLCSWNWETLFIMGFNFTFKYRFFQYQYQNQVHFGISWLVCIYTQYFFGVVRNKLQTKEDLKFKKRNCHVNVL